MRGFVIQQRYAELVQMILALRAAGRFTNALNGGEQDRRENRDDRHHDEQFHERKTCPTPIRPEHGTHREQRVATPPVRTARRGLIGSISPRWPAPPETGGCSAPEC